MLFVCVHNAGRSQMAAAMLERIAGDAVEVRSCGSEPADAINPVVAEAMAEWGVDLSAAQPQRLNGELLGAADVVVTMGCGDACPVYPGKRYEDWQLDDPAGRDLEAVRLIRDEIEGHVRRLATELTGQASEA